MALNKKDFIEIEFTGKVKGEELFDSNIKQDLEKIHKGHDHPVESKPFVFCLGEHMFLDAVDGFLIGKPDKPETYELELSPEQAFGKRNPSLVKMIPMRIFREHGTNPIPGTLLNFDGKIGKTLIVSGGRVMVDFNSPLAGKTVVYKINVKRKITDINEKIKAMNEFLFKRDMEFTVDNKRLTIKTEKNMKKIVEMFRDKFKEIFGLEMNAVEKHEASSGLAKSEGTRPGVVESGKKAKIAGNNTPKKQQQFL